MARLVFVLRQPHALNHPYATWARFLFRTLIMETCYTKTINLLSEIVVSKDLFAHASTTFNWLHVTDIKTDTQSNHTPSLYVGS